MRDCDDTRRSPRVPCDLPMEYQLPGTRPRDGRITKLGTVGALLTTQDTVPLGVDLLISFRLPLSNRSVNTVAKVRWAAPGRAGVEFAHLGLQQRDEIWKFYARESARQRQARS
ncbi:MAG: PilZ domain-containing protein [Candidatus Methylomirabilales bacterium]